MAMLLTVITLIRGIFRALPSILDIDGKGQQYILIDLLAPRRRHKREKKKRLARINLSEGGGNLLKSCVLHRKLLEFQKGRRQQIKRKISGQADR